MTRGCWGIRSHPLHLRIGEVDHIGQFPDVRIAITDQIDERLDVQRERGGFDRHRAAAVREIVVAVDQDHPLAVAPDQVVERLRIEVGQGQIDRAFDMPFPKRGFRACVEQQRVVRCGLLLEFGKGQKPAGAQLADIAGQPLKPAIIDLRIGLLGQRLLPQRRGGCGRAERGEEQAALHRSNPPVCVRNAAPDRMSWA